MLLPRVLTAAVGVPLLLYVIHLGGFPFLLLVLALAAMALYEFGLMLWLGGRGVQRWLVVLGGVAVAAGVALSGRPVPAGGLSALALSAVVAAALLREVFRAEHSLDRAALTVFAALFIGWPLGHLALIRDLSPDGRALTMTFFIAIWSVDTLAYIAGMALGNRRLAEVLSPKKTWEGAAGGFIGGVAAVWIAGRCLMPGVLSPLQAVLVGAMVAVLGQASDLAQSLIKRAAGAKDSASILPGHGGVFDRIDSFLLTAPALYYVWVLAVN